MPMRALLFNPWITDFAAFDHWTRPLNLLRAASRLRQAGWEVELYDCLDRRSRDLAEYPAPARHRLNPYGCGHYYRETIPTPGALEWIPRAYKRYGVPLERVEASLRNRIPPDAVLIPCMMTYWYPGALEAIRMLRRIYPRTVLILGGTYPSLCREHAEAYSGADMVLIGRHWPELIAQIRSRIESTSISTSETAETWIEPAYDLLPEETCFPALTSVGCPCRCSYCATHTLWPQYIRYPWEAVLDSFDRLLQQFHARDIAFYDDALLVQKEKHFLPLMEAVIRRNRQVRFHTPNALHIRQIDSVTAGILKRAGFVTLRLGLETVESKQQRETGDKVRTEEFIEAMQCLYQAGFTAREVGTYVMYGLPDQSLASVWETCRIVHESGSEIKLAMYSPIPGTREYERETPDYLFDPHADPLWHNNSLAPWRSQSLSYESYQQLKRAVVEMNEKLRKNGK